MAQLVERRLQDPTDSMSRGSNPVQSIRKMCQFARIKNRKHEKTQHALVGLGSAGLATAVALLR